MNKHGDDPVFAHYKGKTIAIFGYGERESVRAQILRAKGIDVIIGMKPDSSWDKAANDGFKVMTMDEAAAKARIIQVW
jgi:ketol-acid reductoisomerase